jgi:hypothetical protein
MAPPDYALSLSEDVTLSRLTRSRTALKKILTLGKVQKKEEDYVSL